MSVQVPLRILQLKPTVSTALLVAIASSTAVFSATPFLLPAVADDYGIAVGSVGWMSAAQLSGFVLASWFAGRFLRPVRRVFVIGIALGVAANASSAFAPTFQLLAGARFVSGLSLGLATWIAWQAAFGDHGKTGDVAVVGPLVGVIASPAIAALIVWIGVDGLFLVLAVVAGSPLLFVRQVDVRDRLRPHRTRHSSTRAARAILVALGVITLGGSSVFVYAAAIGHDLDGLSPMTVSLMFSGNSLASIPAAKWTGRRGPAGIWFLLTSFCALAIARLAQRSRVLAGDDHLGLRLHHGIDRRLPPARGALELSGGASGRCPGRDGAGTRRRPADGRRAAGDGIDRNDGARGGHADRLRVTPAVVRRPRPVPRRGFAEDGDVQSTRRSTRSEPVAEWSVNRPDSSAGTKICSYGGRPPSAGSGKTSWIANVPPTATCGVHPS